MVGGLLRALSGSLADLLSLIATAATSSCRRILPLAADDVGHGRAFAGGGRRAFASSTSAGAGAPSSAAFASAAASHSAAVSVCVSVSVCASLGVDVRGRSADVDGSARAGE